MGMLSSMLHPKRKNYHVENLKVKLKIQSTYFVHLWLRNEIRQKNGRYL
jgi:hypothetical protein